MNGPLGLPGNGPVQRFEAQEARGLLPRGWIDGLTLSNDTTDATNDIGIAAGAAKSTVRIVDGTASTATQDQIDLELPVSIIKQLDTAFAPENYDQGIWPPQAGGDRSGGRSSSSLSDTTWHGILAGGGGLQPDVFFHDSITQSSVLAEMLKIGGYTAYRRIGSVIRSTSIRAFTQYNDEFWLTTPVGDRLNTSSGATTAITQTLTVPTGLKVQAIFNIAAFNSASIYISSLDQTDQAGSYTAAPALTMAIAAASGFAAGAHRVWTNTSAQIRWRDAIGTALITIATVGWRDPRGKDS